jgi:hypothetical protein
MSDEEDGGGRSIVMDFKTALEDLIWLSSSPQDESFFKF